MNIYELILIAIAVSMDAFAVSIAKGLCNRKTNYRLAVTLATAFGLFQALMPLLGYYLTNNFSDLFQSFDHWISAALLTFIGVRMIREAFEGIENDKRNNLLISEILLLAIATSIDALAVGVAFSLMDNINIIFSVTLIGITTFIFSFTGVVAGCRLGARFEKAAGILGGSLLIFIAVRILVESLF